MRLNNSGALPTKIYIKDNQGKQIPFVAIEDVKTKELQRNATKELLTEVTELPQTAQTKGSPIGSPRVSDGNLEEFLAQVQFKRSTEIEGYSSTKIQFTFVPYKLTSVKQHFTLFFENQDYTRPIPISISGNCVDVPIYVQKEEYNMEVLVYEQFYREKIILFNRSPNSMKI